MGNDALQNDNSTADWKNEAKRFGVKPIYYLVKHIISIGVQEIHPSI